LVRAKRGPNVTRAETQLGVANPNEKLGYKSRKRFGQGVFERRRLETAASEMAHVFSGDRRQNR